MPSTFRDVVKNCKNCDTQLKLVCTRDIERKNFCSRSCNQAHNTKRMWNDENCRERLLEVCRKKNPKKGRKGEDHHFWGKKHTAEHSLRQSASLSDAILSGRFKPYASHVSGEMMNEKFQTPIFFRSSYEKIFLEQCIEDESILTVKSSPYKILYTNNDTGKMSHYIPDFLIEKDDRSLVLIEVKPERMVEMKINQLKFDAARNFCLRHNLIFEIVTEKKLKI